jgi:uncharacterized protein YraI
MRMRMLTLVGLVIVLAVMPLGIQTVAAQATAPWTVEYYNTTNLTGPVVYTAQVNTVGFDWTADSPAPGVNADFFSARWISVQNLAAGTYQIAVQADDGVRVFVDNAPLIDEFHTATDLTYTGTFDLSAGQHTFQVDYYEGGGVAHLAFDLTRVSSNPNQALAVVQAGLLNVRNAPSVITGTVLTQVAQNETLVVTGRTVDSSWWRIVTDGITGWVSGQWVNVINAGAVPVIGQEPTNYTLTATGNLNIRSGPGVIYEVVGWLPYQQTATVIGRNVDSSWWQIEYLGVTGWVSGIYTALQPGADINAIPITWNTAPANVTLTATVNLNIRSGPGVIYEVVGWLPYQQTATVIGRNVDSSWWQIEYLGVTGWVSGIYTALQPGTDINAIPITWNTPPANVTLTATGNLNIRSGPGVIYEILGWLPYQQTATVIGRNADSSWWQIEYLGVTGWVSGIYTALQPGTDINAIPITG